MINMNHRRMSRRFPMELPIEIWWKSRTGTKRQATGKTGNLSGSGLFMEIPIRLPRATSITIKVQFPKEATKVPLELLCHGRVVRGNQRGQAQEIGVVIDEYELRPMPRTSSGGKRSPKGK
jgi:hypothetical protein